MTSLHGILTLKGEAPERPPMPLNTNERAVLIKQALSESCTREKFSLAHYDGGSMACRLNHQQNKLLCLPYRRPELFAMHNARANYGFYEALHLAQKAVDYFIRSTANFHIEQIRALDEFKVWKAENWFDLNEADAREHVNQGKMRTLVMMLSIFFSGQIDPLQVQWNTKWLDSEDFWLHSLLVSLRHLDSPNIYASLHDWSYTHLSRAAARLGVLLRESTHAFLAEYGCKGCSGYGDNFGSAGHGRAWQRLALTINKKVRAIIRH